MQSKELKLLGYRISLQLRGQQFGMFPYCYCGQSARISVMLCSQRSSDICNQRALPQKSQDHRRVEAAEDLWRSPRSTPPFAQKFPFLTKERILEQVPNKCIWDTGEIEAFSQMRDKINQPFSGSFPSTFMLIV